MFTLTANQLRTLCCRDCFAPLMTFKFRRSLEPYVNARPDGPRRTALKPVGDLMIGFSGGLGSTVLLDLVNRFYISPDPALLNTEGGSNHPRNERVWKKVYVCYVEISDALPGVSICYIARFWAVMYSTRKSRRRIGQRK
jgi:cytoplasmic tRNA 2-thiolation protein 2